jgi:Tfp pilus assembly protein PilF
LAAKNWRNHAPHTIASSRHPWRRNLRSKAYDGCGAVFFVMKDFDRALTEFNQAIRLDAKESSAYYGLSLVYQQKGSDQLATTNYDKAIQLQKKPTASFGWLTIKSAAQAHKATDERHALSKPN